MGGHDLVSDSSVVKNKFHELDRKITSLLIAIFGFAPGTLLAIGFYSYLSVVILAILAVLIVVIVRLLDRFTRQQSLKRRHIILATTGWVISLLASFFWCMFSLFSIMACDDGCPDIVQYGFVPLLVSSAIAGPVLIVVELFGSWLSFNRGRYQQTLFFILLPVSAVFVNILGWIGLMLLTLDTFG